MKYGIGVLILIVCMFGYMYKHNKDQRAELKKEHEARIQAEKQNQIDAEQREKQRAIEQQQREQALKDMQAQKEQEASEKIKIEAKAKDVEKQELDVYSKIFQKWGNQSMIASSTARISLATPLTEMRKIRDELNATSFTGCIKTAKDHLLEGMDAEMYYMMNFMQDKVITNDENTQLKIKFLNKTADAIEAQTACKAKLK